MGVVAVAGGVQVVSQASGGKVLEAYTTTAQQTVAPANPSRQQITFHNTGEIDIFVGPALIQTTGASVPITFTPTFTAGSFLVFANGGTLVIQGECQGAWVAISRDDSGFGKLTIMDSNVG